MHRNSHLFYSVYITTPNIEEARRIGIILIQERLAACVNFWEGIHSIYEWDGQIMEDTECILIAKTHSDKVEFLIKKVEEIHPYQVPCILTIPLESGSNPFLEWIRNSVNV